jgi:sigma-B regulation protein RsbU (phosphoserine phosphatase)
VSGPPAARPGATPAAGDSSDGSDHGDADGGADGGAARGGADRGGADRGGADRRDGVILVVGALGGPADAAVAEAADAVGATVRTVGDATGVPAVIGTEGVLAVVTAGADGIDTARAVQHRSPGTPVLLVHDDHASAAAQTRELRITPGISPRSRCVTRTDLGRALEAEVDLSRRRRQHRATVRRVSAEVAALVDAAPEVLTTSLSQLFDHAPIGIVLTDRDGTVRSVNPCARRLLGRGGLPTVGLPLIDCLGEGGTAAADLLADSTASGDVAVDTVVRTTGHGGHQHLEVTVAPVDPVDPRGGSFVLLRDETARVQAIEEAQAARHAAEEAAGRLAAIAATLQESLLPPSLPRIEGVELASWFRPAGDGSEIGGDFFDVFDPAGGGWCAVIGDVCGKGVAAARLTALTRYTLRSVANRSRSCATDLSELNATLLRDSGAGAGVDRRFVTAAVLRFSADGNGVRAEVGTGGHPPALLVRVDGRVEPVASRGPLLGVYDEVTFHTAPVTMAPGDVLVLHTDGVTEARRGSDLLGEERLAAVLAGVAGRSAAEVVEAVRAAVLGHQAGTTSDDVAVLVLRADGPA